MATPAAPGLFGKLPWEGDFLQRGLPSRFVRPWDKWLARAMAASQQDLGSAWADAFLLSPPWRFLIEPGVINETGWAGVLVSSVDKVRRYFPLTLALELAGGEAIHRRSRELDPLLQTLENTALGLIEQAQPIEAALAQAARQIERLRAQMATDHYRTFVLGDVSAVSACALIAGEGHDAPLPLAAHSADTGGAPARSCWWHARWNQHASACILCDGLPQPSAFAAFFDGAWDRHGWRQAATGGL